MTDRLVPSWTTPARVVRVIDADTLEVEVVRKLRIRVLDCWAPETHETGRPGEKALGLEAKAYVEKLFEKLGPEIVVRIPTEGDQSLAHILTLGRFLGDVELSDGRLLATVLRRKGFAASTKEKLLDKLREEQTP